MDSEQSSAAAKVRLLARSGQLKVSTTGLAPTIQANLLVLPSKYASDFILLCKRNPVPCPLLSVIPPGSGFSTSLAPGSDIRTDLPAYNVYNTGKLIHDSIPSIEQFWSKTDDYTGFLIGCSYSFETALSKHNLAPPHMVRQMIVSMYTTTTRLLPAGVFTEGTMVVSMRPYKWSDIPRVRDITRPYHTQHGEPIAWGWAGAKSLGVEEKVREGVVDWGEWVDGLTWAEEDGEETDAVVPVFWGCGCTIMRRCYQRKCDVSQTRASYLSEYIDAAGLSRAVCWVHVPKDTCLLPTSQGTIYPTSLIASK